MSRGLTGEYFDDQAFTDLVLTRIDPTIDFDWGTDAPDSVLDPESFAVRWRGEVWIDETDEYTFTTVSDDGVRLWVDGRQVIDSWQAHAVQEDRGTVQLEGGRWYPLTLEYYDVARRARIALSFSTYRYTEQIVPTDRLRPLTEAAPLPASGGLTGEYFDEPEHNGLKMVRIDPALDFFWATGSPSALVEPDTFSVRWTGEFFADRTATYTFTTASDDNARLWINDRLVTESSASQTATGQSGSIELEGGRWHAIRLEFDEVQGNARVSLTYTAPGASQAPIPSDHLRPATTMVAPSTTAELAATPGASPEATGDPCATPLQTLIDWAAPGSTVSVPPCVYRETIEITKPLTLDGGGQAEIRGSDVWADGWQLRGSRWVHENVPALPDPFGECRAETSRCRWPHQVFLDGAPLLQVAADPVRGQFAVDKGAIVLADEPNGHVVEVTHRQYWVLSGASDVVIDGFTMRHAASPAQHGAINVDGHSNWTVRDTTLSDAHGMLVTFEDGAGYQLLDSELARGGETGVGASGASDVLYRGNRIHHNNTEDFDSGWSAGGTKNARVTNLVVEGNEVYANVGPGIWCDVDCVDVVIRQNRVHHNWSQGIQYEISRNALIAGNVVWENGWGSREWCFGAGILVQNSHDVAVEDNLLAWNANGLVVISQERGQSWDRVTNTSMRDNTIISTADGPQAHAYCEDWSGVLFEQASNNRSSGNRYWYPETEGSDVRFGWGNRGFQRLADFNAASGTNHGKYIDTATMHQVLAATGVPSRPEADGTATSLPTEPSTPVPSPVPLAERVQKDG